MGVLKSLADAGFADRAQQRDDVRQALLIDQRLQLLVIARAALFVLAGDFQPGVDTLITQDADAFDQMETEGCGKR